ncbi:MAG TPA: type II toxin-antitoxin system RelE/ParE family toxin [candidate division WOR-3 bacterium]|uniref:Type II toxin-antitoxin system RelE/ParE family toxin n=1 Tax=candidate division WOR-3 bacterium TaxID=2052148 RepID=A0A9C9EN72_UNCW3|nr:type II toxin-antitoxin system RelE/ParE family toxin [candidate division WOR-3 bacterium]
MILSPRTEKFLDSIHKHNRRSFKYLMQALDKIAENPYTAKPLLGSLKGYYSYRVGNHRIIFEINKKKSEIYVEKIAHRSVVYKR